jgi:hypothetical protein
LHHIRPKLFRPLDFPAEKENTSEHFKKGAKLMKRTCHSKTSRKAHKKKKRVSVLPTRAMVARYIAVVMLAMKTTV